MQLLTGRGHRLLLQHLVLPLLWGPSFACSVASLSRSLGFQLPGDQDLHLEDLADPKLSSRGCYECPQSQDLPASTALLSPLGGQLHLALTPLFGQFAFPCLPPAPVLGLAHTFGVPAAPWALRVSTSIFFEKGGSRPNSLSPPSWWRNYVFMSKTDTESEPCARVPQGLALGHLSVVARPSPLLPPPGFIFFAKNHLLF